MGLDQVVTGKSVAAEVHEMRNENEKANDVTKQLLAGAVVQTHELRKALPPVPLKEITDGS
jgi:hypothetical protein